MKFNIRAKLITSFFVVVILSVFIGILGINLGANTNGNVVDISQNRMPKLEIVDDIVIGLGEIRRYEVQAIFSASMHDTKETDNYMKKYDQGKADLEKLFSESFPKFKSDTAKKLISKFNTSWNEYQNSHDNMMKLVAQGNINGAIVVQRGESRDKYDNALAIVADLDKYNKEQTQQAVADAQDTYNSNRTIIIIIIVLSIVISIIIALYISNSISKGIQMVVATAEKVGNGDLTVQKIEIKSKDELLTLSDSINKMVTNLRLLQAARKSLMP